MSENKTQKPPKRTDYCGRLRREDIGSEVTVCGWVARRREHGEHLAFIDLRDRTGIVQCVVDHAHDLRAEYVLSITGTVRERPSGTANPSLATGEIELGDTSVTVLAEAEPPPFAIDGHSEPDEALRMKYRYLDLRNHRMQSNLVLRSKVNAAIRRTAEAHELIEIETPLLIASTPEGARDFLVPSRMHPGSFYALPQSPQLFKQLCMVGGIDRYYQIARCLRDEGMRSDRQMEFSQFDLEMSFAGEAEVRSVVEDVVAAAISAADIHEPSAPAEMTWRNAMERYGSDKPDLRFGMELADLTEVFADTEFNAFKAPSVKGIRVPDGGSVSRAAVDQLTEKCRSWGAKGLVWMRVSENTETGELDVASPVAKFMSAAEIGGVLERLDAAPGDMCYLVADTWRRCVEVLGLLRMELGRPPVNMGERRLLWVTDFPLFEAIDDNGMPIPAHHPFTMPHPDDMGIVAEAAAAVAAGGRADPEALLSVRSQAYDLVLNGWELGSGSVRINNSEIQQQIFTLLGISPEAAQQQFGFLLEAFRYGAPPHAGFAFGIDRLTALLCGEDNIREVIAFPKSQSGADPLTAAPSAVAAAQLAELGISVTPAGEPA